MFRTSSSQPIFNYHSKTSKISIHLMNPFQLQWHFVWISDQSGLWCIYQVRISRRHITPHYDTNPPNLPINLMQINFVSSQYTSQPPTNGEQNCDQLSSNSQRIYHNYTLKSTRLHSTEFKIKVSFLLLLTLDMVKVHLKLRSVHYINFSTLYTCSLWS